MKLFRLFTRRSDDTSPAPETRTEVPLRPTPTYDPRFLEFIEFFAEIGNDNTLFPKTCRTCGREYENFPEYLHSTRPLGHGLEDCTDLMEVPYIMQYRNCMCGSTLVLTMTSDTFPVLEKFWQTLRVIVEESGRPLRDVVNEFREQCNRYVIDQHLAGKRPKD